MAGKSKLLSGFRKPPKATELDPEDAYAIAVHGALAWFEGKKEVGTDWDDLSVKAVELHLSGLSTEDVAKRLGVTKHDLMANVDIDKIGALINSQVAKTIYTKALAGDKDMLKLVAGARLGWGKKDTITINGELTVRPVLNISLLTPEEERRLKLPDIDITCEEDVADVE